MIVLPAFVELLRVWLAVRSFGAAEVLAGGAGAAGAAAASAAAAAAAAHHWQSQRQRRTACSRRPASQLFAGSPVSSGGGHAYRARKAAWIRTTIPSRYESVARLIKPPGLTTSPHSYSPLPPQQPGRADFGGWMTGGLVGLEDPAPPAVRARAGASAWPELWRAATGPPCAAPGAPHLSPAEREPTRA